VSHAFALYAPGHRQTLLGMRFQLALDLAREYLFAESIKCAHEPSVCGGARLSAA
jgi:hypothetical protein